MGLAAVRDLRPQLRLETADEVAAFEQDLLAEFVLARASAGITDATIRAGVAAVVGLREWWADGPRWEFDDRVNDPAAPLFPSERRHGDGSSRPVTDDALRTGLAEAVAAHLPGQAGALTPHLLRHYAASQLYRNGMDVFAVQEVLGHEWINTTMIYVHVHRSHVEEAWVQAGRRAAGRLGGERP